MFLFVKGLLARVTLCAGPRLSHLFEWLRFAVISVLMSLSTDLDLDLSQAEPGGLSTPPDEEASQGGSRLLGGVLFGQGHGRHKSERKKSRRSSQSLPQRRRQTDFDIKAIENRTQVIKLKVLNFISTSAPCATKPQSI